MVRHLDAELDEALRGLPNVPAAVVPHGADETANVDVRQAGTPRAFDFQPLQHFEISERLRQMDFQRAARLAGARFVYTPNVRGPAARRITAARCSRPTGRFTVRRRRRRSPPLHEPVRTNGDSAVEGTAGFGRHGIATEGNSWYLVRERRNGPPRTSTAAARSRTTARMKEAGMAGRPPARAGPHGVTARTAAVGVFGTSVGQILPPLPPQERGTRADATGSAAGRPDPAARRRA